jgi:hypothetical protein
MRPLAASEMKEHRPRHPFPGNGHNSDSRASFDERPLWHRTITLLLLALRDPRLSQRHRAHIAVIVEHMDENGDAYPGRKTIARDGNYTDAVTRKTISEILAFGYFDFSRRAPPSGGRALAHYTLRSPDFLRSQIQLYLDQNKKSGSPTDVTRWGDLRIAKVTPSGDIKSTPEVTSSSDVRGAKVTPVVPTVLREERGREGDAPAGAPPPKMSSAQMASALNPDAAFALRNIKTSPSGKLEIGDELRIELAKTYSDSQIERALERAPSQLGSLQNPLKVIAQIRRCASYAKQDDEKRAGPNFGGGHRTAAQPDPFAGLSAEQRARVMASRANRSNEEINDA